jgi:GH25 family lysozyme M1 (1,4-beta-N-acetylmuramidase)
MVVPLRGVPRRAFAAIAVLAAALAVTLARGSDGASGGKAASGGPGASWARTVTGAIVPVTPAHLITPIHPEVLTHPDAMGGFERSRTRRRPAPATKPLNRIAMPAPDSAVVPNPIGADSSVAQLPGIDVSNHQGAIDWTTLASRVDFVYVEATEGTYFRNADFENQYDGPYHHGVIRGAYHFAIPNNSSGTTQADYFLAHGGGWSADGLTLPGALDVEYNPYGAECYGLTANQMVAWIDDFVTEYAARTHAYPVIYTTADWWNSCTAGSGAFTNLDPVWVANYNASDGGPLPGTWGFYTFWQYADSGSLPGDQDTFNGALDRLKILASQG